MVRLIRIKIVLQRKEVRVTLRELTERSCVSNSSGQCGDYPGTDVRKLMRRSFLGEIYGLDIKEIEEVDVTEWSPRFEFLMKERLLVNLSKDSLLYRRFKGWQKNRLQLGGFRYGFLDSPDKPQYDRLVDIEENRLVVFAKCLDPRLLADVANFCLLEFVEGNSPARHLPDPSLKVNREYVEDLRVKVGSLDLNGKLVLIAKLVKRFRLSQNLAILADIAAIAMLASEHCTDLCNELPIDDESTHTQIRFEH